MMFYVPNREIVRYKYCVFLIQLKSPLVSSFTLSKRLLQQVSREKMDTKSRSRITWNEYIIYAQHAISNNLQSNKF